jgi:hypothetical protein
VSVDTDERPDAQEGAEKSAPEAQLGATFAAGADLFAALRRVAVAVKALLLAEARLLRASVGVLFLSGVALVAFAVSLWVCTLALIGWALTVATGSVGVALAILVVLQLILIVALWYWIKRVVHQASFPATRAELRTLGRTMQADVARFQTARPQPAAPEPEAEA